MDDVTDGASFEGDPPAASESDVLSDWRELALVAVERTRMPMVVSDARQPDFPLVLANQAFLDLTGYSADEVIGRNCRFLQGRDTDPAGIDAIRRGLDAGGELVEVEILNYRKDGSSFLNQLIISSVTDEAGEVMYHFASQKDVTARRRVQHMEATERLLLMEVDHRAMNALALVQSFVSLSKSDTVAGYAASIRGRVNSLARAHRLLGETGWSGADFSRLLAAETPEGVRSRIAAKGLRFELPVQFVQPMALVLHELMSNATRHGALRGPGGSVEIEWFSEPQSLRVEWRESGAEDIGEPAQSGVGLRMVESIVRHQLGGSVTTSWPSGGLRLELMVPVQGVR